MATEVPTQIASHDSQVAIHGSENLSSNRDSCVVNHESRQVRFDAGRVTKTYVTPEGFLVAEANFARDGILEYRNAATGKITRELRLPEENQKALRQFANKPLCNEHPPVLLDIKNARQFAVGMTNDEATYEDPFVKGKISVFDGEAIDAIRSGKASEVSMGYRCRVEKKPGIWNGQHYDAIQRDLEVNHACICRRGRAGPDVRVYLDSLDDEQREDCAVEVAHAPGDVLQSVNLDTTTPNSPELMNTTEINRNGVTYKNIPIEFATYVAQEFNRLDALESALTDSEREHLDSYEDMSALETHLDAAVADSEQLHGRCDAYEDFVNAVKPVIEELGFYYDGATATLHTDEDEEEEYEDEEEEEDEDEYEDSFDSLEDRVAAWEEAEMLMPGFKESHFDSYLDTTSIRALVLNELDPDNDIDLDVHSDSYVEGRYEQALNDLASRSDSQPRISYTDELEQAMSRAHYDSIRPARFDKCSGGCDDDIDMIMDPTMKREMAYKKPLSYSKKR